MARTAYEIWQQAPRYQLPHEAVALRRDWWTTAQAAKAWHVSARTARRDFERIGATPVMVRNVRTDRVKVLHCVPAGTLRPPMPKGNPKFRDPAFQAEMLVRRWDGHITRAQLEEWERQYEDAALRDLAEDAAGYLGEDSSQDDDWVPYPMPEPPDPDEPPPPVQYTEKWLRDAKARRSHHRPRRPDR